MAGAPRTARARARAELTSEIKRAARDQLAEVGAASLSLRAVARELGMASSALYRYFPGRDELLTALIVDAYDDLADVAVASIDGSAGEEPIDRWLRLARAIRGWAVEHPNEYALIYGSPVPGYAAPLDTTEPVQRLTATVLQVFPEGWVASERSPGSPLDAATRDALDRVRGISPGGLDDRALQAAISAWTQLFGHLSFELFGHFHTVVEDYDAFFDAQMREAFRAGRHPGSVSGA